MQSARILAFAVAVGCAGGGVAACSMITGLSKDYSFDGEGGASGDDGGKVDGAVGDGATTSDGGGGDGGGGKDSGGGEGVTCTGEAPCTKGLICCGNSGDPSLTCNTQHNCQGKKVQLDCTRSNDCGLQVCCVQQGSGGVISSSCSAACSDKELCDLAEPKCRLAKTCQSDSTFPAGFGVCN